MVEFSYGIITVSDRCHRGEAKDESGPRIKNLLQTHYNAFKISQITVPDEQAEIEKILLYYSDELKINCIFTTGGTGCAPRDVTPEATRRVIQREFPQLSVVMLFEGLRKTQFAALSRGVCGIRGRSLIVNFPGSVKAVTEGFEAIRQLIPHAIELICDMKSNTEALHSAMQDSPADLYRSIKEKMRVDSTSSKEMDEMIFMETPPIKEIVVRCSSPNSSSNSSSCNDIFGSATEKNSSEAIGGQNPGASMSSISSISLVSAASDRHVCPHKTAKAGDADDRNSPYPMVSVADALKAIFDNVKCISSPKTFKSPMNCPPFRASIKDGYAVKSSSSATVRKVIGSISAGDRIIREDLQQNECYKINTGAAIPDFCDAVVQVEDTKLIKTNADGTEAEVELKRLPAKNLDIREIGSDLKKGEILFTTKGQLDVAEKTLLASVGFTAAEQRPKIAIISTGDELQDPMEGALEEESSRIFDSNTTMLRLLCEKYNFDVKFTRIARDDYESLKIVVQSAMNECRAIISSGGVSMGDKDFVKKLLIDLGFHIHFGRVNVKPGKPMTFATHNDKCFFGLPGNPVSAYVTFHLFVLPALRYMCGHPEAKCTLPSISVILQDSKHELDDRPEYVRASVAYSQSKKQFYASITSNQISSRIASLIDADVLLQFPPRAESKTAAIGKGAKVRATVLSPFFVGSHID